MKLRRLIVAFPFTCLGCLEARPGHQFEAQLLDVAQSYESYHLVDASSRWAPVVCGEVELPTEKPSPPVYEGDFDVSQSEDSQTHGRKLYVLFAKQMQPEGSYVGDETNAIGQVIVKEAWAPEEVKDNGKPLPSVTRNGKQVIPFARSDDKLYHAKEKAALFIMFKMDPRTPETDEGWVYGTVTPDGKHVTSAGKVESCMKCHQKAPLDRLFGLPSDR